jgi:hypothetical protein
MRRDCRIFTHFPTSSLSDLIDRPFRTRQILTSQPPLPDTSTSESTLVSVLLPSSTVPRTDEVSDQATTATLPRVLSEPSSSLWRRSVSSRPTPTVDERSARTACTWRLA